MSDEQTPDVTADQPAGGEPPVSADAAQAADNQEAPPARAAKGRRGKGRQAAAVQEPEDAPGVAPVSIEDADDPGDATASSSTAADGDDASPDARPEDDGGRAADSDVDAGIEGVVGSSTGPELFSPDEVANAPRAPHPLKPVVEALIFASPEPLTVKAMVRLLEEHTKEDIEAALVEMRETYARSDGLQLVEVAGGFQIVTRPELYEWVRRLFKERSTSKLSVQALETLAVIAYKQPVTSGEIAEIRGVSATTGVLNTLLDRKLVKIVGRKQVVGRPFMYGTTREFLDKFGLKDLSDLPKVEDMSEALGFDLPNPVDDGDGVSLPFEGPVEPTLFEEAGRQAGPAAAAVPAEPAAASEPAVSFNDELSEATDPSAADERAEVAALTEVVEVVEVADAVDAPVESERPPADRSADTDTSDDER